MRLARLLRCNVSQVQKLIGHERTIVREDKYIIHVRGGSGGNGLSRYGGVGGNGGNVYFVAKPEMSFLDIKKNLQGKMKIKASSGISSQKIKLIGIRGEDTVFPVPVGVEAVDESKNILIARCNKAYQKYLIATGGDGGSHLNSFKGQKGDDLNVSIHLKLRPNLGLVGFPNAGKSTLLKAFVPRKSVKIAPYPFTTVNPQLAFYRAENKITEEEFTLSIADLPGLIEGASMNRGKGHKFLKHLEYCETLCFIVDVTGFQLSNDLKEKFRSPLETVALLNRELEEYDRRLVRKPAILIFNKIDLLSDIQESDRLCSIMRQSNWHREVETELRPRNPIRFDYVFASSVRSGDIEPIKKAVVRLHKDLHSSQVPKEINIRHSKRKHSDVPLYWNRKKTTLHRDGR